MERTCQINAWRRRGILIVHSSLSEPGRNPLLKSGDHGGKNAGITL